MTQKHRATTNSPSQRQLRVGEQLRHIVAETLQRGHFHTDPLREDSKTLTVTEVRVSPDLKHARAYVVALGGQDMTAMITALAAEAHIFQKEINRQSALKFTPKIQFVKDDSFDKAQRIEDILRELDTE